MGTVDGQWLEGRRSDQYVAQPWHPGVGFAARKLGLVRVLS